MTNVNTPAIGNEVEASTPFYLAAEGEGIGLLVMSYRDVPAALADAARAYIEVHDRNEQDRLCCTWDWYERASEKELVDRLHHDEFVEEERAKAITDAMKRAGLTHFVAGGRLFIDTARLPEPPTRHTPRVWGEDLTEENNQITTLTCIKLDPPKPRRAATKPQPAGGKASRGAVPSKVLRPRGLARKPAGRSKGL